MLHRHGCVCACLCVTLYYVRVGAAYDCLCCVLQITTIADAQALWADIQAKQKGGFKAETEEEFEDDDGNVYNKRTYLDLKKQGLI